MDMCTVQNVVQTFEFVDEIWCDNSSEISSAVVLHDSICFSVICKMKLVLCLQ